MATKDGGAAFPQMLSRREWSKAEEMHITHIDTTGGMSLRDWMAGQAMHGMLSQPDCDAPPEKVATWAYGYADAMLKAREKA